MTKILVWNVQQFGINKFNSPFLTRRGAGIGGLTLHQASKWREQILAQVLFTTNPDILIIIEVSSGDTTPNSLASLTGGMDGCIYVLQLLRNTPFFAAGNWRLVPPLRIGQGGRAEAVGVFYRGQSTVGGAPVHRYFTGPNWWTGGYNGQSARAGTAFRLPYPSGVFGGPDIQAMLVPPGTAPRNIPNGAQYNGGISEDQVAARTQFRLINPNGTADGFLDYAAFREPYMVTFTETDGVGTVQRDLTIFAVHSPAVTGNQSVFITYLANTHEVVSANGGSETRVICGDFNLNLLAPNGNDANEYAQLVNQNYAVLLQPAGGPPAPLGAYPGYFATHIKRRPTRLTQASRFLWSDPNTGTQSLYPGYEYVGSYFVQNFYSVDNILVRPYNGGHNYDTTIMNPVVGTPFNMVAPAPGNPPIGSVNMGAAFTNAPVNWPQAPAAPNYAAGLPMNLTSWVNYGYIYSTSDHFALYADI